MDYNEINDNELLSMICENSEEARAELVKKYTGIVYKISFKYAEYAKKVGIEEKDLVQEGLIGLSKAIDTYNTSKQVLFYTYVTLCIESAIKSAIKIAGRKRNLSLNTSISLDQLYDNETQTINEIIKDESLDPSVQLLDKENLEEILDVSKELLAPFEFEILKSKIEGYSHEEIAKKFNKNKKSIENTMFRIKQKLKDYKK